jgi:excisionase family DNA binding protein
MADTQDKLYTLQEVADYLRVTRQTIYNYVTAKKLKAFKAGREYRVTEEELQAFIKSTYNTNK